MLVLGPGLRVIFWTLFQDDVRFLITIGNCNRLCPCGEFFFNVMNGGLPSHLVLARGAKYYLVQGPSALHEL